MLLQHTFDDAELNLTLEVFLRMLYDVFADDLVSVVLYGSLVFADLAPGYGDLDFLAVVKDDIREEMHPELSGLRKVLRSGDYGIIATMIEGEFVPRKSLGSPDSGKSYYWGTGGDRPRDGSSVRGLVAEVVHQRGVVIFGEDIRSELPRPTRAELVEEVGQNVPKLRAHGRGGGLHAVDWLLTIARFLLFLRESRLSSKSEAADWGRTNAGGAWRECLPEAKRLRKNPWMADLPHVKRWLDGLTAPIQEACDELEEELANIGNPA